MKIFNEIVRDTFIGFREMFYFLVSMIFFIVCPIGWIIYKIVENKFS